MGQFPDTKLTQEYGLDYEEIFASCLMNKCVRTILVAASFFQLQLDQMDVKNAFLNGDLWVKVYITFPPNL